MFSHSFLFVSISQGRSMLKCIRRILGITRALEREETCRAVQGRTSIRRVFG